MTTSAGARAPLAHVANQVFLELVGELKTQGLGNKVIADMFGLALRTYHARLRRLSESKTYQGRSLWEAVLEYVQSKGTLPRAEVLRPLCVLESDAARLPPEVLSSNFLAALCVLQQGSQNRPVNCP